MKKILLVILSLILSFCPTFAKDKFKVTNDTAGIYVFKINTKKYGKKIKPYMTKRLTTPQVVYEDNCFDFVVNGGFLKVVCGDGKMLDVSCIQPEGKKQMKTEDFLKGNSSIDGVILG